MINVYILERQIDTINDIGTVYCNTLILKEGRRSLGDITDAEAEVAKPEKRLELSVINRH